MILKFNRDVLRVLAETFPKIAARVSEAKQGSSEREAKKLTTQLEEQKERKNNMGMDGEFIREEFEDAKSAVHRRIYEIEEKLHALESSRVTASSLARFADLRLTNMATVWSIARPEQREWVPNLLFETGLDYSPEKGLLNRSKSSLFHVLEIIDIQKANLVEAAGVEPVPGIENTQIADSKKAKKARKANRVR